MQQKGQTDISFTARETSQVFLFSTVQIYILYNPNEKKKIYFLSSTSALYLDTISKMQTSYKNSQRNFIYSLLRFIMANILPICFIISSLSPSLTWTCEHVCVHGCRHTHIHTHTHKTSMIIPITLKYLVYILRTKTFFTKQYYSYPHKGG